MASHSRRSSRPAGGRSRGEPAGEVEVGTDAGKDATTSFEAIGKEKDNVVKSLVGLKGAIISPFAGIAK